MDARAKQVVENIKAGRVWNDGLKFASKTAMAMERKGILVRANPGDPHVCYGLTLAPEYR